jgi:hypothetical protein
LNGTPQPRQPAKARLQAWPERCIGVNAARSPEPCLLRLVPMDDKGRRILHHLDQVASERVERRSAPGLEARVQAVKAFQQSRLAATHADLLADPRCAPAARFFLDELYGPQDFTQRDAEFARVVPALVRLFPGEVADIVERVAALHVLSERLDTEMGAALPSATVDPASYAQAWRQVGQPESREAQIASVISVGLALERHAKRPMLRHSLRWMRGPAQVAGLAQLQAFLESGLEAFATLPSASEFLDIVSRRERRWMKALFEGRAQAEVG